MVLASISAWSCDEESETRPTASTTSSSTATTVTTTTEPQSIAREDLFQWPQDCTPPAIGRERTDYVDILSPQGQSWTDSSAGRWLEERITASGFAGPFDAGSAWVLMHGADGVAFLWFGPPNDTGDLALEDVGAVQSAEISPTVPYEHGAYRPAVVDSVVAGGVRLWLLTNPRDGYEFWNFGGLTTGPCLPAQEDLRQALVRVAASANDSAYAGSLPTTAGRFAVNSDRGMSETDPGDLYLMELAQRVLGRSIDGLGTAPQLDANDIFIFTQIPPIETDTVTLAGVERYGYPLVDYPRTFAGGLSLQLFIQAAGWPPPSEATIDEVARIAIELNWNPFLGQPIP